MHKLIWLNGQTEKGEKCGETLLPVTTIQPPRMSRTLHSGIFEYRSTETCPDCHQSLRKCGTCGSTLPVDYTLFCREHGEAVVPLYYYYREDSNTLSPIRACPICHALDWWADEKCDFRDKQSYFANLNKWIHMEPEGR